ncbi:phospholipase A2 [Virgisporangium aurantiacum]|uniref:Phospholipase A2 n=1 Tax=Virgisporangium aurantiacum TaxID=175570 RepID=A0A8J4E4U4_9ACTN|nr:phospholipase A2 [Virgisporangium aurantiacum]GIJ62320.1 hypothetical protein Vau01_098360 [Virgisporangium aurantiacum]
MTLSHRLAAACATVAAACAILTATPAHAAFPGAPEDVRFVEIANDHVDLTFVDMSNAEIEFQVEYKQLGTTAWSVVRTYRDHRSPQPGATGVTIRINNLPHTSVGGCYTVWVVGANARLGTPQKCTKPVPYAMKMARTLSWTAASESSFDGWHYAVDRQRLYTEFEFDWSTDYCSSSPDQPSGFDFRLPCRRHDFGYRNFRDLDAFDTYKSRVDGSFLADMLRVCDGEIPVVEQVCDGIAWTYYQAVVVFGAVVVSPEEIARFTNMRAQAEAGGT